MNNRERFENIITTAFPGTADRRANDAERVITKAALELHDQIYAMQDRLADLSLLYPESAKAVGVSLTTITDAVSDVIDEMIVVYETRDRNESK
jgi:hypothetical protein